MGYVPASRPFVRSPYNYDTDAASLSSGLVCSGVSKTQQQFRDECDINVIASRFGISGMLPVSSRPLSFGDFTSVSDFHTAMNAVRSAEEAFMQLPAVVRDRFSHDPQRYLEFCSDPGNLPEMRKLGIALPEPVEAPSSSPPA